MTDEKANEEIKKNEEIDIKEIGEKSKQLAKISKRIDELKERLEGGSQLKADDIADKALEYKILKHSYEQLLKDKDLLKTLHLV